MKGWYVEDGSGERGPISSDQLRAEAKAGKITPTSRVRRSDQADWRVAASVKGLFDEQSRASGSAKTEPPPLPPTALKSPQQRPSASGASAEQTFFESEAVLVTNKRIVFGETTYPVANVTSASVVEEFEFNAYALILWVLGILLIPMCIGFPILFFALKEKLFKPYYVLRISTAGIEKDAVSDPDEEVIRQVATAVDSALISK